ncbi:hypothetical protein TTHERM_001188318 (macronuclear) [Tetrahymena thermophila SB210]|uniref:Uncharacterized protein n=1 Tax=Tetrahymena thermophila (strain SB210) TaxID=312017 RepID=W7XEF7_TETTS|nr:hypothetical protein TTHERM_001188318 [Tetrahymena thermophila SB210]EWS75018.1 hypothetical protein TTHERM_001188318 [Tetrahymena thermophila SB210]|eukprot:XP_012652442.1 hypothetical protein TTHERM_001188318 [Tetrahymena thermophila SB210]
MVHDFQMINLANSYSVVLEQVEKKNPSSCAQKIALNGIVSNSQSERQTLL